MKFIKSFYSYIKYIYGLDKYMAITLGFFGTYIFVTFLILAPTFWFFRLTGFLCPPLLLKAYEITGFADNLPFHQEYLELENVSKRSNAIEYIGYTEVQYSLGVVFQTNTNRLYVYSGVPEDIYEDFINSESPGSFFNTYIEPDYDYTERIDDYERKRKW